MRWQHRKYGLTVVVASLTLTLGLACTRDVFSPKVSRTEQSKSSQVTPYGSSAGEQRRYTGEQRRYTKEELHSRNRFDWFGQAHNHVLALMMSELRKPEVKLANLCERMVVVLSKPEAMAPFASKLTPSNEAELRAAVQESPICDPNLRKLGEEILKGPRRITKRVSYSTTTQEYEPGSSAIALYEETVSETEQASDAQDLASRLSPIVDAAYGLTGLDVDFVLMGVAVAQYSFDYWAGGADQDLVDEIMETEIEPCYLGQAENETFEADGDTWMCQGQEWRQIRYCGLKRSGTVFQLASYAGTPALGSCAQDGYNFRWGHIGGWDVGALGLAGLVAKVSGPNPTYLYGVAAVSGAAGLYEAGRWIKCNVF